MQDQKQQNPQPFKVGDKVVSKELGGGVVILINRAFFVYPILCKFASRQHFFALNGRFRVSQQSACDIQHAEPEKI